MTSIILTYWWTYADITETPPAPRFKYFDDIEYGDTYSKWSVCVRVEVKFCPNKYAGNISFSLMDKTVTTNTIDKLLCLSLLPTHSMGIKLKQTFGHVLK
jgi:hypothetical protein